MKALVGLSSAVALVAAVAASSGCVVSSDTPYYAPPYYQGSLVVDWTIAGTKDPNACAQFGASTIDVGVYDAAGGAVGDFRQACTAFATSVVLPAGTYTASAFLMDPNGQARTTRVFINPFRLYGNDQFVAPIEFPPSSFY